MVGSYLSPRNTVGLFRLPALAAFDWTLAEFDMAQTDVYWLT